MQLWGNEGRPDHCYNFLKFLTLEKLSLSLARGVGGAAYFTTLTFYVWRDKKNNVQKQICMKLLMCIKGKKRNRLISQMQKLIAYI